MTPRKIITSLEEKDKTSNLAELLNEILNVAPDELDKNARNFIIKLEKLFNELQTAIENNPTIDPPFKPLELREHINQLIFSKLKIEDQPQTLLKIDSLIKLLKSVSDSRYLMSLKEMHHIIQLPIKKEIISEPLLTAKDTSSISSRDIMDKNLEKRKIVFLELFLTSCLTHEKEYNAKNVNRLKLLKNELYLDATAKDIGKLFLDNDHLTKEQLLTYIFKQYPEIANQVKTSDNNIVFQQLIQKYEVLDIAETIHSTLKSESKSSAGWAKNAARHLFNMSANIFNEMDLFNLEKNKTRYTDAWNALAMGVINDIISASTREQFIAKTTKYLDLAQQSIQLGDQFTASAILGAINNNAVYMTHTGIQPENSSFKDRLQNLSNKSKLLTKFNNDSASTGLSIPFLGAEFGKQLTLKAGEAHPFAKAQMKKTLDIYQGCQDRLMTEIPLKIIFPPPKQNTDSYALVDKLREKFKLGTVSIKDKIIGKIKNSDIVQRLKRKP